MLDKEKLIKEIRKINDPKFEEFYGWKGSFNEYCQLWAEAIRVYAVDVYPPSITSQQAKSAMAVFLSSSGNVRNRTFENSVMVFTDVFAPGMNPNFTGIVPNSYLDLSSVFSAGLSGASSESIATKMGNIIHDWFLTGTAINNNSGITINWS